MTKNTNEEVIVDTVETDEPKRSIFKRPLTKKVKTIAIVVGGTIAVATTALITAALTKKASEDDQFELVEIEGVPTDFDDELNDSSLTE